VPRKASLNSSISFADAASLFSIIQRNFGVESSCTIASPLNMTLTASRNIAGKGAATIDVRTASLDIQLPAVLGIAWFGRNKLLQAFPDMLIGI
jgi:hypothetical protein